MFSAQDLTAVLSLFSQQDKATGLKFFRQSNLRIIREEEVAQGKCWTAEFKNGRNGVLTTQLTLIREKNEVQFKSTCTCRTHDKCVHRIAVLWRLLADQRDEEQWEKKQGLDEYSLADSTSREHLGGLPAAVPSWIGHLDAPEGGVIQEFAYRLILLPGSGRNANSQMIWRVRYVPANEVPRIVDAADPMARHKSEKEVVGRNSGIRKSGNKKAGEVTGMALNMPVVDLTAEQWNYHPADLKIDALLQTQKRHNRGFVLAGPLAADLLTLILQTGRLYLELEGQKIVRAGDEVAASLEWQQSEALWGFGVAGLSPVQILLRFSPPWVLDCKAACLYPLRFALPTHIVDNLLQAPWQDEKKLVDSLPVMRELLEPWGVVTPPVLVNTREIKGITPRPILRLSRHVEPQGKVNAEYLCAFLELKYDRYQVNALPPEIRTMQHHADHRVAIERMRGVEQAYLDRLQPLQPYYRLLSWQCPDALNNALGMRHNQLRDWISILNDVPNLEAQGWEVIFAADFPWGRKIVTIDKFQGQVEETDSGANWINLSMELQVDGKKISLIPLLTDTLSSLSSEHLQKLLADTAESKYFSVVYDGQLLCLTLDKIRPMLSMLLDLFNRNSDLRLDAKGRLRLARLDAADFISRSGTLWQGSEGVRQLALRLSDFAGLDMIPPPETLKAELRPYQQEGLNWLQFLTQYQLSGILADDMGLGKTIQTMAHLCVEKQVGRMDLPVMIICPKSVIPNWKQEFVRFVPDFRVLELQGYKREDLFSLIARYDVVLTSYSLLTRDIEHLQKQQWSILVCDEAQQLKNHKTLAAKAIRCLKARQILALTGTPMENHLGELWALFDLMMPGFLGHETHFRRLVRQPIEKQGDMEVARRLSRRIRPLMLRRTKEQVARELPPKTEIVQRVVLLDGQRELYEIVRASMDSRIRQLVAQKGLAGSNIEIIEALLKLRQVCCDPRLLTNFAAGHGITASAKLAYLIEVLPALVEDGRRILVFSQFTSMLALIAHELRRLNLGFVELTGSSVDRETPVKRFQNGEIPVFLLSLKAGGVGLNLTAADTVFIYDPWWNPAAEAQAADRAYRIGQDKPVFVYKLVCEGTVEEQVLAMQQRKGQLAEGIYGAQAKLESLLTAEDLQALFQPMHQVGAEGG